ncbi:MAG: hypothetical protein D6711_12045 [Chloroflexi bacterium]|nr:MAG: hypothetical protein D6711_12045 [Chloroflexota bacterium]
MSRRLLLLLIVFWGVMVFRLDSTWDGTEERVWIAAAIRNYHYYDFADIGLMVTRNPVPGTTEDLQFYTSHPPVAIWIPAILTEFLGFNELAIRYASVAATLLSATVLYVIGRRLYNNDIAFWATLFYAGTPFIAYYSRLPGYTPFGMLFSLLYTAIIINWLKRPTQARFLALLILTWLAVWTAWAAVFFIGTIGIIAMWQGQVLHKKRVVLLGISSVLAFITLIVFYQIQWEGSIDGLVHRFLWRTSNASGRQGTDAFNVLDYLIKNFSHIIYLATPSLFFLSIWGVVIIKKRGGNHAILIGLLLAGVLYQVAFRNASYIHPYYKAYLVPAMALSAGFVVVYARKGRWKRPIIDGLIASMMLVSVGVIGVMHFMADNQPWIFEIINTFQAQSTEDDILAVNFIDPKHNQVIQFYLFRPVVQIDSTIDIQNLADESQRRVLYIYCTELPATELVPTIETIFDDFAMYDSQPLLDEKCHLFFVEPQEPN